MNYSDIREGDIVEFDCKGRHYGPGICGQDWDDDWAIVLDEYFMHLDGTPFDGVSNIVIHREMRTCEPKKSGLYVTQSGLALWKRVLPSTGPWNILTGTWSSGLDYANWEFVVAELDESEFPLRKAKAVTE